ncbi:MAG: hypothetical protein M3Y53_06090 [Thermoproteota archaeon]|nr:hypothetical protein [Thermoproteota archaeon]
MSVSGFDPQTLKNLIIEVYRLLASKIDSNMLLCQRIASRAPKPLTIILIALAFGALAFLYSFIGFFSNEVNNIITFDAFGSLTPQEIGGHFLFGYVVALPTRNLKMGLLSGLMALTIDADHLLNAAGFDIQARMGHSVSFAILSSVLIGLMGSQIFRKVSVWNEMMSTESSSGKKKKTMAYSKSVHNSPLAPDIYSQYLIITLAAFISHIAYDVFVNAGASFPLLAPLIFSDFFIPQIYALPIEAAAILLVYLWYTILSERSI